MPKWADRLAKVGLNKFQHTVDITFNSDEPVDIRANMIYNDANTSLPLLDLVMFSQRWKLSVILRPYRGGGGGVGIGTCAWMMRHSHLHQELGLDLCAAQVRSPRSYRGNVLLHESQGLPVGH